jgi:CheY-like chemotaxis protein
MPPANPGATRYIRLILGLWLACMGWASNGSSPEFESSPLRQDAAQADWLRQKAKQTQESYRLRVAIPRTTLASPMADGSASALYLPGAQPPADSAPAPAQDLLLVTLLCLCGLLVVRKLAPEMTEIISARLFPWHSQSSLKPQSSAEQPPDERAFNEFLVAYNAGPAVMAGSRQSPFTLQPGERVHRQAKDNYREERDSLNVFFTQAPEKLLAMRNLLQGVRRECEESAQQRRIGELRGRFITLKDSASRPELLPIWQVASVVAGLVGQLVGRTSAVTPNTLRTIANGLDLLIDLCQEGLDPNLSSDPPIRLLAVDDDLLTRHAVAFSLKKAYNQPDVAANGEAALAQASMIAYDVIFLDIQMPNMDGFELCSKIRETSLNRHTPIVFVTCHSDLDARARSNLCGGTDLIGKPFLTFEITVKALTLALRARLEKRKLKSPSPGLAPLAVP